MITDKHTITSIAIPNLFGCPFCGKTPTLFIMSPSNGDETKGLISCPDGNIPGIELMEMRRNGVKNVCPSPTCIVAKTIDEAITQWNKPRVLCTEAVSA